MIYIESTLKIVLFLIVFANFQYGQCKVYEETGYQGEWKEILSCGTRLIVCGTQIRIQKSQGQGDDTGINGIRISCCSSAVVIQTKQYGGVWGDWAPAQICNYGSSVVGYSLKMDRIQGAGDDTAMCGFTMVCKGTKQTEGYNFQKRNFFNQWGFWKPFVIFEQNEWINAIQVRFKDSCGDCDDTAMNGIRFFTGKYANGNQLQQ